jgi:GH25 family lysozyme M1 (1,4-beta-N-acetylmuramidase)
MSGTLPGVDVSSFQGPPGNWRAEAGKITWAAVKLTELGVTGSRYVSPVAAPDWAFLQAQGKGRIAYLFGHPGVSATASAGLFLAELNALGLHDGDGIALDLEVTDGRSAAWVASWAHDVLALLERETHRKPLLYTFLSFAQAGNCAGLGKYPLWIADPSSPRGHPRVPAPWKTWAIHQHAISGNIDRDVAAYAGLNAMRSALGRKKPPVTTIKADGKTRLHDLAGGLHVGSAHLLRLQASPSRPFPHKLAAYVNEVFAASKVPVPEGVELEKPS